jgi:hypothetical protein
MINEYTAPEVIEIGKAQEVIFGAKPLPEIEENGESTLTDSTLDD